MDGSGVRRQVDNYTTFAERDDSPILGYRYENYRHYVPYTREQQTIERHRRYTLSYLAKFFLFSTAMIMFCVLLYIPVYNKANDHMARGVAGWSMDTNRDTKIYVQPNNVTTIHDPKAICPKDVKDIKNKLFLLIIVCSATNNFDRREAIRETWGNYQKYRKMYHIYSEVRNNYLYYNYTHDLYPNSSSNVISGFSQLLPELAKALQNNLVNVDNKETDAAQEEKRFDDYDEPVIPEFDMNKELGDKSKDEEINFDYEYESNIMKIPPRGMEEMPNLEKILALLKQTKTLTEEESVGTDPDFELAFLLGVPSEKNDTDLQDKIEKEVEKYGDIIQEGFVDSYNNLTLKSIMMLKWLTGNCGDSVRYVLKTDDDMYINVPNLVYSLRNRSRNFDSEEGPPDRKEYLLLGDLICGARPVHNYKHKWFSPRYMYNGRVYPRYLSGTGYVMSSDTAHALYEASLRTNYFHLEDVYITGICAYRAVPPQRARDDPTFSYLRAPTATPGHVCRAHGLVTAHKVTPADMAFIHDRLMVYDVVDTCERKRLTQKGLHGNQMETKFISYEHEKLTILNCTLNGDNDELNLI